MSTVIRPQISNKNRYWIERHRYYELKHFCLQYPIWKQAYAFHDGYSTRSASIVDHQSDHSDDLTPTERHAEARIYYADRMKLVEQAAIAASPEFSIYLLKAVTEGLSYDHIKASSDIPCCKDVYYDLYRRFFWLLNQTRK